MTRRREEEAAKDDGDGGAGGVKGGDGGPYLGRAPTTLTLQKFESRRKPPLKVRVLVPVAKERLVLVALVHSLIRVVLVILVDTSLQRL